MKMKKMAGAFRRRVMLGWLLMLVVVSVGLPSKPAWALSYGYNAYPEGKVGLARPDIGVKIRLSESLTPSSYSMYLNGREVPVTYDDNQKVFLYKPTEDLEAREYTARLLFEFKGYERAQVDWSFTILPAASSDGAAAPSQEQEEGLRAINDYRTIHGLPLLRFNPLLNMAAQKHAHYLAVNRIDPVNTNISMHQEDASKPAYFGQSLSERADYVGYPLNVSEDVSYQDTTLVEAIDSLFDAPYHRIPYLNPNAQEIGIYKEGKYHVIEFGVDAPGDADLVVSPANGDSYVPTSFDGNELPDPLRMHTGRQYPVGYPIVAVVNGRQLQSVQLVEAELKDAQGQTVEILKNDASNDEHLDTEVILLPALPLERDTRYEARIKVSVVKKDGTVRMLERTWSFRTEPIDGMRTQKLHKNAPNYALQMSNTGSNLYHTASFGLEDSYYTLDQVRFPMKLAPYLQDGTSYLYIRDLAAALGATVEWDEDRQAAVYTKGNRTVTFFTTRSAYAVNGAEKPTDFPAQLISDNTLVPVRLLAETLGAKVDYSDSTQTVMLTY